MHIGISGSFSLCLLCIVAIPSLQANAAAPDRHWIARVAERMGIEQPEFGSPMEVLSLDDQGVESSSVRVDIDSSGVWNIDLGQDFLLPYTGMQIPPELDARLQAIRVDLLLQLERQGLPVRMVFRFNGKSLEDIFPGDTPVALQRSLPQRTQDDGIDVFVSASHGFYFHHSFNDWRLQRPLVNGMVEDLTTPAYATQLSAWLNQRGNTTRLSRSISGDLHPVVQQPWWQMASRYHAQALYPDRPDIWRNWQDEQAGGGAEVPLREYNDDIRTRPLLANEYGARALIHLHTNAAASSDATGTMAFHQPGREQDKRLGENILCGMKAAIQAVPQYREYRVRTQSMEGNYGENRLATAPSTLIEIGFHTNPSDAMALQDPVFQAASTIGMEQGYQDFLAGRGTDGKPICE